MPERFILRAHFTEMLRAARTVAGEYDRFAQAAGDPAERDQLRRLARNGRRHVELTERLLEIIGE